MKRNTQRIVAGLIVFLMIDALVVGIFANSGSSQPAAPAQPATSTR